MELLLEQARKEKRNLTEPEAYRFLTQYGIPIPRYAVIRDENQIADLERRVGFPLVMKIISPDITHKTDVNGLCIGIRNKDEALQAFKTIKEQVKGTNPHARIHGILAAQQVPAGVEVSVGMTRDVSFGPVVMFGLGGIFVEVLKDVAFRVCPVAAGDIFAMVTELKGAPILNGYRGTTPCDLESLGELIAAVSCLALANPMITAVDLNPVIAYEHGVCIVDAKIYLDS